MLRKTPLRPKRPTPRRKGTPAPRIKPGRVEDPEHLTRVRSLPCSVCGASAPSAAHHIRDRQVGAGQKAGDDEAIPLCHAHHQDSPVAFHVMGLEAWEAQFGTQRDHLAKTLRRLAAPSTT